MWKGKRNGRLLRVAFFGFLILWPLILMIRINQFGHVRQVVLADAAIVLGAAVWRERPSPVFEERIKHGITLYQSGAVEKLIFTGGLGERDSLSEAEVARNYALARGVPDEAILIETSSTITLENLIEAQTLMAEQGLETAVLVSDPLHMYRSIGMAQDLGMTVYTSPTPTTRYRTWRSKAGSLIYESFFYTIYLAGQRPFLS
jgi:uncharacterized SAM-binding protein YcdF (DUF218 family)